MTILLLSSASRWNFICVFVCLHLPSIPKVTTKPSVGYLMFFYSFTYCIKFFFRFCRFVLLVGFNLLLPVSVICLRLLHRSTKTPFQIVFSISTLEWSVWYFVLLSVFFFFNFVFLLLSGMCLECDVKLKLKREYVASVVGLREGRKEVWSVLWFSICKLCSVKGKWELEKAI